MLCVTPDQNPPNVVASKPCIALVRTNEGLTHECPVANLCERGVFLRTGADLTFRQRVKVDLLGLSLYGQVLFVSADPPGVVVSLETDIEAQARLLQAQDDIEVLEHQLARDDEPWAEDTAAGVTLSEDDAEDPPPALGTADLVPIPDDGAEGEVDDSPALDPMLFAAAMQDDALSVPPETIPMLDAIESAEVAPSPFDFGAAHADGAVTDSEVPVDISVDIAIDEPVVSPIVAPEPPAVPPPAAPPPVVSPPVVVAPAEVPPAVAEAPPSTDDITSTLPALAPDGYTVLFESPDAYRTQFDSNLRHGGLVVRAEPLSIGTQRMLALAVPGQEPYTVSARVVFHEPGKLGFMLDSLAIHKTKLEGLAG